MVMEKSCNNKNWSKVMEFCKMSTKRRKFKIGERDMVTENPEMVMEKSWKNML